MKVLVPVFFIEIWAFLCRAYSSLGRFRARVPHGLASVFLGACLGITSLGMGTGLGEPSTGVGAMVVGEIPDADVVEIPDGGFRVVTQRTGEPVPAPVRERTVEPFPAIDDA
jgi:hypothetical protein